MGLTKEEIIELTAVKVQEVILPKIESFTDGVIDEVHKIHLELKDSKENTSALISQVNDFKTKLLELDPLKDKVRELHVLFLKNGYMQRFNQLLKDFKEHGELLADFFKTRADTCPIRKDVQAIKENLERQQKEALEHAEGKLRTREQDKVLTKRWRVATYVSLSGVLVAGISLATKLLGWW